MADRPEMSRHDGVALRDYIEALLEEHVRLHSLLGESHLRDHQLLSDTVRDTAAQLAMTMRTTADHLAQTMRETAETHWKNHEREHIDAQRAIDNASSAIAIRLDNSDRLAKENKADANEWRDTMNDREARFATKEQLANTEKGVSDLAKWKDRSEGKSSGLAPLYAVVLTIVGSVAGALLLHYLLSPR